MESKLIVLVHINALRTRINLDVNIDSKEEGPGVTWENVYNGINNAANLFVKYHNREISDGTGRQALYSIQLFPMVGEKPIEFLSIPDLVKEDLRAVVHRIITQNDEKPGMGLIIHIDNDHNKFCLGGVQPQTLAELVRDLINELENITKIKLFSCCVEEPDEDEINLNQTFLAGLEDLPHSFFESAFPSLVWIGQEGTPGQTAVRSKGPKEPGGRYKSLSYHPPYSSFVPVDISKYSNNRKGRKFRDFEHIVQRDLARIFQTKVRRKRPDKRIQGLKVVFKSNEHVYIDGTENGTKNGTVFEVHEREIIGVAFDKVQTGDRFDMWIFSETIGGASKKRYVSVSPQGEFTANEIALRSLEKKIESINNRFQKINVEIIIDAETVSSGSSNSTIERSNLVDVIEEEEQDGVIQELNRRLIELNSKIKTFKEELSRAPADFSNRDFLGMQKELDEIDDELTSEEEDVHDRLHRRFTGIREKPDNNLVKISWLIMLLDVHYDESTDEADKLELKEMQNRLRNLYDEFWQGRDELEALAKKIRFGKDDEIEITKLIASLPAETQLFPSPRVVAMEKEVGLLVLAKKQDQLLRWQKTIATLEEQIDVLQDAVNSHAPSYLKNSINKWSNALIENLTAKKKIKLNDVGSALDGQYWVDNQRIVNNGYHEIQFFQNRVEALINGIHSYERARKELEERFAESCNAFSHRSAFAASFIKAAKDKKKSFFPAIDLSIGSRLSDIIDSMIKDPALEKRIEHVFLESGLSLELIENVIDLHRIENGLKAAAVFQMCETKFAMQSLNNWTTINFFRGRKVPTDGLLKIMADHYRESLSILWQESRLPKYATDVDIEMLPRDMVDIMRADIETLKSGHIPSVPPALLKKKDNTYQQTFDRFLQQSALVGKCLNLQYPEETKKVLNKVHEAFEERRSQIQAVGNNFMKILPKDIEREKRSALAQLLKHLHDVEEGIKAISEPDIVIDTTSSTLTDAEKIENEEELAQILSDVKERKQAEINWTTTLSLDRDLPTSEELSAGGLLQARRTIIETQLEKLSPTEKKLVIASVDLRLLDDKLKDQQSQLSGKDKEDAYRRLTKEIDVRKRRQLHLEAFVRILGHRVNNDRKLDNSEFHLNLIIDSFVELRRDESKVWLNYSNMPSVVELNENLISLQQALATYTKERVSLIPNRCERLREELSKRRHQSESIKNKKHLSPFHQDFDDLERALTRVEAINVTTDLEAQEKMLIDFDEAENKWRTIDDVIERKLLSEDLRDQLAWLKRQINNLRQINTALDIKDGSPLTQKLAAFEGALKTKALLMATEQPIDVMKETKDYSIKFKDDLPLLTEEINAYLIKQIPRLVIDNQHIHNELVRWQQQNELDRRFEDSQAKLLKRHENTWVQVMGILQRVSQQLTEYQKLPDDLRQPQLLEDIIVQAVRLARYQIILQTLRTQALSRWSNELDNRIDRPSQLPSEESANHSISARLVSARLQDSKVALVGHLRELDNLTSDNSPLASGEIDLRAHYRSTRIEWRSLLENIERGRRSALNATPDELARIQNTVETEKNSRERRQELLARLRLMKQRRRITSKRDEEPRGPKPPPPDSGEGTGSRENKRTYISKLAGDFNALIKRTDRRGASSNKGKRVGKTKGEGFLEEWVRSDLSADEINKIYGKRLLAVGDKLGKATDVLGKNKIVCIVQLNNSSESVNPEQLEVLVPLAFYIAAGRNVSHQADAKSILSTINKVEQFSVQKATLEKMLLEMKAPPKAMPSTGRRQSLKVR